MHSAQDGLKFDIIQSIGDIPREAWDRLFGSGLIEGYGYQKTLEESGMRDFSFGYLSALRKEGLSALFPFFILDFSCGMLLPLGLHKPAFFLQKFFPRFLKIRILFLGSPTTEEFYLGLSQGEDLDAVLEGALKKLRAFCRRQKIRVIAFHNLSEKNAALADSLKRNGFIKMETLPTTSIEIKARSLAEYIQGLGKNMRKDLKKKISASGQLAQLRTEMREDADGLTDDIYKLYLNNFNGSDMRFETLTPEFFRDICRNMPGVARYFITYDKDKIVAFNLCLIQDNTFIDKFIGFDSGLAHKYHLYFTTFCHNLQWCFANGMRFYQPGITDYHPKVRLGAKLIPLYIYAKAFNPLLNGLLRVIAPFVQPKNLDPGLKEIKIKG